MGIETVMLGDTNGGVPSENKLVFRMLNYDLLPEDKLNFIKKLREKHQKCGDGRRWREWYSSPSASTVGVPMVVLELFSFRNWLSSAIMSDYLVSKYIYNKISRKGIVKKTLPSL